MQVNPQADLGDLYPEQPRSGKGYSALVFDCLCALWTGPMRPGPLRQVMRINERRANKNCERILVSLKRMGVIHQVALQSERNDRPHPALEIANRQLALTILAGPVSNRGSANGNHVRVVPQPPELTAALQERRDQGNAAAIDQAIERERLVLAAIGSRPRAAEEKPAQPVILPELQHQHSGISARNASHHAVCTATYGNRPPVLRAGALDALRHQDRHRYGGNVEQSLGVIAAAGR